MKSYSIKGLMLAVLAVAVVIAILTQEVEVAFTGNQPDDFRKGWTLTLHEGDRYTQNTRKINCVFVQYDKDKQTFFAKMRLIDWSFVKKDHDYSLEAPELLFWPTVRLKDD